MCGEEQITSENLNDFIKALQLLWNKNLINEDYYFELKDLVTCLMQKINVAENLIKKIDLIDLECEE